MSIWSHRDDGNEENVSRRRRNNGGGRDIAAFGYGVVGKVHPGQFEPGIPPASFEAPQLQTKTCESLP